MSSDTEKGYFCLRFDTLHRDKDIMDTWADEANNLWWQD